MVNEICFLKNLIANLMSLVSLTQREKRESHLLKYMFLLARNIDIKTTVGMKSVTRGKSNLQEKYNSRLQSPSH
jgi:hypothetical protein